MNAIKIMQMGIAAVVVAASVGSAQAATYSILGGSLQITGSASASANPPIGTIPTSIISLGGGGTLAEGGYQDYLTNPVAQNMLFPEFDLAADENLFITYTASSVFAGDGGPHAAPQINWVAMTADLGSFYANWYGVDYVQGSTAASITSLGGGNYRLAWSTPFLGNYPDGELTGYTGNWTMDIAGGPVPTPVPSPAALWLLGSGLMALMGFRTRVGV